MDTSVGRHMRSRSPTWPDNGSSTRNAHHAGFDHEAGVETVANITLSIFTNYFNHIAGTENDLPLMRSRSALFV